MVSLAGQPLGVLLSQEQVLEHAAAEQRDDEVAQHRAVTRRVARGIRGAVDVAAHDPVQVSPPDDDPQRDPALVHALGVVRGPGDGVGDARVDAQGPEEGAGVPDPGAVATQEHRETDDAEHGDADVAEATLAGLVGDVTDGHGQDGGGCVRRHGEELGPRGRVAQVFDDGGQEEREGVQRPVGAHVDDGRQPGLPVLDGGPEVGHLELLVLGAGLLIGLEPTDDAGPVDVGQEGGLVREVVHHPEGGDPDEHGQEAFEDEDPGPAALAADAAHQADGGREQSAEGPGHGRGREEDGHADAELGSFVPAGQVVTDAGEEAGLGEPEEPTGGHHAAEVVRQTHGDHDDAPNDHDGGDEDGGPEALQGDVGGRLEDGVGDEEDGQGGVVLAAGDVQGLLQAVQPGVADVGPIEKGHEVQQTEPGDQFQVEPQQQLLVLWSAAPPSQPVSSPATPEGNRRTMRALSASLRCPSGSGGSSSRPSSSKPPGGTPILFSSSDGEWPLSLSRPWRVAFIAESARCELTGGQV